MYRIEVALPVHLARNFTYLSKTLVSSGQRVRVPFGSRKLIGVALGLAPEKNLGEVVLKEIEEVLDDKPILSPSLIQLAYWMSQYYLHPLGEVFKTMLPSSENKTKKEYYALKTSLNLDPFLNFLFDKKKKISSLTLKKKQTIWNNLETASVFHIEAYIKEGLVEHIKTTQHTIRKITEIPHQENTPSVKEENLSSDQNSVLEKMIKHFAVPTIYLLHGVTGSGKTRVYISTILETLKHFGEDSQTLLLVPEIALTPQMTQVFEDKFPGKISVVHSALSQKQRWDELCKIREGTAKILIGARSAIFASFKNLKLILVDEEHDQSYKQNSGLSYNARDLAVVRAKKENINCILGSATPSVESYCNALQEKYKLLELKKRVIDIQMPKVEIIPTEKKFQKEFLHDDDDLHEKENFLSPLALETLRETLEKKQQAIVLVNRRGYAYYLFNEETKAPIECPSCSISLTVHKKRTLLICHYCDYQISLDEILSKNPKSTFTTVGVGSQKAEAFLKKVLPHAKIARLDSDVLTSRENLFPILSGFRKGDIDILVGTQILAKGHDFPNVGLTVICELDQMLDLPDFRSGERTFQLLVQSAGRAGRSSSSEGRVLIQSSRSSNRILKHALEHDYKSFVMEEIELRKNYAYPPFQHLIRIEITSCYPDTLNLFCTDIVSWQRNLARNHTGLLEKTRIIGPVTPPIEKINKRYRKALLLSSKHPEAVHRLAYEFLASFPLRSKDIRIQVDVDPQSLL